MKHSVVALLTALIAVFLMTSVIEPSASAATIPPGPTVIGVDGTTVNRSIPIPSDVVAPFQGSVLDFNDGEYLNLSGYSVVINDYPRSFGLLSLGGPDYDDSVAQGVAGAKSYIRLAQDGDPSVEIKLVCQSQGADVCSQTNDQLVAEGYDQSSITYILLGNVDNAAGGLKTRIPKIGDRGIFIPGPGVTLGNTKPTTGSDATIIQVSYEYDFFARTPEYPLNLIADLNAAAGAVLEHGNYANADPYAPDNIVSTTPDGQITNIVIPVDEVPLLTVARMVGLPQPVANIINPALKAIVDTGYAPIPEGDGNYPTEAQPIRLLPTKEKFEQDIVNVRAGLRESGNRLEDAVESVADKLTMPNLSVAKKQSVRTSGDLSTLRPNVVSRSESNRPRPIRSALSDVRKTIRRVVGDVTKPHRDKHDSESSSNTPSP